MKEGGKAGEKSRRRFLPLDPCPPRDAEESKGRGHGVQDVTCLLQLPVGVGDLRFTDMKTRRNYKNLSAATHEPQHAGAQGE